MMLDPNSNPFVNVLPQYTTSLNTIVMEGRKNLSNLSAED